MYTNSYCPNYFSIDDILVTQERTLCKFVQNVLKLGKLDQASDEKDLKVGTCLELPLWLALEASVGRQPMLIPELPKFYKETYQNILKADPCAVDLHKFGQYFYEVGAYSKHFDSTNDVAEILLHTFITRFRQLMDLADNTVSDPSVHERLDALEKMLYDSGHNARGKLNAWMIDTNVPLEAANMVINLKKRKRTDIEDI